MDKVFEIVKYFQVEIFCLVINFGTSMDSLLSDQLVENKICINRLNVSQLNDALIQIPLDIRNDVLKETAWQKEHIDEIHIFQCYHTDQWSNVK